MLTHEEIVYLSQVMAVHAKDKKFARRAGATLDPKDIKKLMDYDKAYGYSMKDIYVYGDRTDYLIEALDKALDAEANAKRVSGEASFNIGKMVKAMEEDNELKIRAGEHMSNTITDEEDLGPVELDIFQRIVPYFNTFHYYGFKVHSMRRARVNKCPMLKVYFESMEGTIRFYLFYPAVNKDGHFWMSDRTQYVAQYMPKNLHEYLLNPARSFEEAKNGKVLLKLRHVYEFLNEEMVTYRTLHDGVQRWTKEQFARRAKAYNKKCYDTLQKKMTKIIFNTKDFGEDKHTTPIVWMNRFLAKEAKESLYNCVALLLDYDMLAKYPKMLGLDYLTGSTAEPARRVKLAKNFMVTRYEEKDADGNITVSELVLVEKPKDQQVGEYGDYASPFKCESPFATKCGGKRNNDSTSKDAYELVNPTAYVRKVRVRMG